MPLLLFEQKMEELESKVPMEGHPLAVQAQSAMICLICVFKAFLDKNPNIVIDVSNAIVGALDNYMYFLNESLLGKANYPDKYPLLERELAHQLASIAFIKSPGSLFRSLLMEYRLQNLQFSVPIAM